MIKPRTKPRYVRSGNVIDEIRAIAYEHGYAIGVHGSMRRCLDCGGDCYGWSESTRCPACWKARRPLGALGLQPGGVAEAAREARLERRRAVAMLESDGTP